MELVSGRRLQNRLGLRDSPGFWKESSIFEAILGLIISYVCELLCQCTQYVQLGFISPFHLFMMKACLFVSKIPWVQNQIKGGLSSFSIFSLAGVLCPLGIW